MVSYTEHRAEGGRCSASPLPPISLKPLVRVNAARFLQSKMLYMYLRCQYSAAPEETGAADLTLMSANTHTHPCIPTAISCPPVLRRKVVCSELH